MSPKLDFKHDKRLYAPSASNFVDLVVPPMIYLAVDGSGDPNTAHAYKDAVGALYSASYTAKFASKNEHERDFVVGPLEGLWWADHMGSFVERSKDEWQWTVMIRQPDWLGSADLMGSVAAAMGKAAKQRKSILALDLLYVLKLDEGRSVQILHVGSYDSEAPTLARLHHEFLPNNGLTFNGKHHEIYLSDARRVAPTNLRTVLRQPVRAIQ